MVISCDDARYDFITLYSMIMVAVYPIGMPLVLLVLLWSRSGDIAARKTRAGGKSLNGLSFFFSPFNVGFWWMAVLDMYRRLSLSSLLLWLKPTEQLIAAFCVGWVTTVAAREASPFYDT